MKLSEWSRYFLWLFVTFLLMWAFLSNSVYKNEIKRLDGKIDSLTNICFLLLKIDSTARVNIIRKDTTIQKDLMLRDTCGIYAYNWIKYFSREYPWIERQMNEDNKEIQ